MFNPFDTEDTTLDEAIASAFLDLAHHKPDSSEYQSTVDQLTKLYALKEKTAQLSLQAQTAAAAQQLANDQNAWQEEQDQRPFYKRVDPNTAFTVAGNLLVALIVIKYEERSVISTKALTFMKKF